MNKIRRIMNLMGNIKYGFLDEKGNNIFNDKNVEKIFSNVYYLMSPEELLEKKVGVCWDQVELERKLFNENNIKNETYFIYIDDKENLPSHTFLVYYKDDNVYWFEHSWFDEKGIHEYKNINELLNDVENKFKKSKEKEIKHNYNTHIYKYEKPNYNISCNKFYKHILKNKEIYIYKLAKATNIDLERIKEYKFKNIYKYAKNLPKEEINKINNYVNKSMPSLINDYKNIIYNEKVIGSFLIKKINEDILLDEIYIEKEYRNKGLGSSIIKNYIINNKSNIYLWVYKENKEAFNLYKKLGFIIIDETETRYYMQHKNN